MTLHEEVEALLAKQPPDGMACVVCLAVCDESHLKFCPYRLLRALLDEHTRLQEEVTHLRVQRHACLRHLTTY